MRSIQLDGTGNHESQFQNYPKVLKFKDRFNRKWKLVPVSNENIKFPFIITPLSNDP